MQGQLQWLTNAKERMWLNSQAKAFNTAIIPSIITNNLSKANTRAIIWKMITKGKVAESYMPKVSKLPSFPALSPLFSRGTDKEADCKHVTATE